MGTINHAAQSCQKVASVHLALEGFVSQVENGQRSPSVGSLARAAQGIGVSSDYLLGLTDGPSQVSSGPSVEFTVVRAETVAAGFDGQSTLIESEGPYPFRAGRLREEDIDPEHSAVFNVGGSSMYPTLPDGCTILVDYRRTTLSDHHIYVYRSDGDLFVKRMKLRWPPVKRPRGEWWWCSDNPADGCSRWKATDTVLGEVRWVGHALNDGVSKGP